MKVRVRASASPAATQAGTAHGLSLRARRRRTWREAIFFEDARRARAAAGAFRNGRLCRLALQGLFHAPGKGSLILAVPHRIHDQRGEALWVPGERPADGRVIAEQMEELVELFGMGFQVARQLLLQRRVTDAVKIGGGEPLAFGLHALDPRPAACLLSTHKRRRSRMRKSVTRNAADACPSRSAAANSSAGKA